MHGLFGPLDEVELADVEAFLRDAGEEGVTWEAKADDDEERNRPEGEEPGKLRNTTIHKAVCGLANQIGGYLIIGARWDSEAKQWNVAGVRNNNPEPETWLGDVIEGGLSPVPRCEVRAWRLDDDRILAIVEVQPIPEPPCMTRQGHMYERVSGKTVRVTDPALLDGLRRRGDQARNRADANASHAAGLALDYGEWVDQRAVGISIGLATVGRETDDISPRLFVPSFQQLLRDALGNIIDSAGMPRNPDTGGSLMRQSYMSTIAVWLGNPIADPPDHVTIRIGPPPRYYMAVLAAHALWDGSVSASISLHPDWLTPFSTFDQFVAPAWKAIGPLLEGLGGYGPTQLRMAVRVGYDHEDGEGPDPLLPPAGTFYDGLVDLGETHLGRFLDSAEYDDTQIASLHRELQRVAGIESFEPET